MSAENISAEILWDDFPESTTTSVTHEIKSTSTSSTFTTTVITDRDEKVGVEEESPRSIDDAEDYFLNSFFSPTITFYQTDRSQVVSNSIAKLYDLQIVSLNKFIINLKFEFYHSNNRDKLWEI